MNYTHGTNPPSLQREAPYLPIPLKIPSSWYCCRTFHSPRISHPLPQMQPRLLVMFSVLQLFALLSQMAGQGILPIPPSLLADREGHLTCAYGF